MAALTEQNRLNDVLKWESGVEQRVSREVVTVLAGQDIAMGAVLGKVTKVIPTTGTKDEGNTGAGATGANAASVTGGTKTQIGTYTLTCLAAADQAIPAVFEVKAPDGARLPDAHVAVAYVNPQINFTLAEGGGEGAVPFAAGDIVTIPVTAGSGSVKAVTFAAVDGSQEAYGFSIADYDATEGAVSGVAIVRDALIVASGLVWPNGASAGQKSAALAQLATKGILERDEV